MKLNSITVDAMSADGNVYVSVVVEGEACPKEITTTHINILNDPLDLLRKIEAVGYIIPDTEGHLVIDHILEQVAVLATERAA